MDVQGLDMLSSSDGNARLTLTEWIAIMGGIAMLFTQLPTFHSLRYVRVPSPPFPRAITLF